MLNRLYSWYGKYVVWGVGGLILLLGGIGLFFSLQPDPPEETTEQLRTVEVSRIDMLSDGLMLSIVGTVAAVSEVEIQSEISGRITRVYVSLGDRVRAGQTIVTLENASEYAALLQAEGVYDAAIAASASSDVGVSEARSTAVSTYRNAYATVNSTFRNTIDQLYSNPYARTPGVRIESGASTSYLNKERYAFNDILNTFQETSVQINTGSNLDAALNDAEAIVRRTQAIVDTFISLLSRQSTSSIYTESQLATLQTSFATAQQSLNSTLASIQNAQNALDRASLAASGSQNSSADAQIKQALGSLRAAQANYAKTVIKTPIGGTVNTLPVKVGNYISAFTPIAHIANNNALEITTYINESDRNRIAVGDRVTIEGRYEGTVATIAPALDQKTKKIEVKIQTDAQELTNGDTVRLSIEYSETPSRNTNEEREIVIPITALKVETDRLIVFSVDSDGTLVAHPVVEGPLLGDRIVIESGITSDMAIVLDARGLNEGDAVSIRK